VAGDPLLAGGSVQRELELTGGEWLSGSRRLAQPVSRFAADPLRKPPAAVDLDGAGSQLDPALPGVGRRRQFLFVRLELPVGSGAAGQQPEAAASTHGPEEMAGRS